MQNSPTELSPEKEQEIRKKISKRVRKLLKPINQKSVGKNSDKNNREKAIGLTYLDFSMRALNSKKNKKKDLVQYQ